MARRRSKAVWHDVAEKNLPTQCEEKFHSTQRHHCKTCNRLFANKHALYRHKFTHKPAICRYCEKTFSKTDNLTRHIRTIHHNKLPTSTVDSKKPEAKGTLQQKDDCTKKQIKPRKKSARKTGHTTTAKVPIKEAFELAKADNVALHKRVEQLTMLINMQKKELCYLMKKNLKIDKATQTVATQTLS